MCKSMSILGSVLLSMTLAMTAMGAAHPAPRPLSHPRAAPGEATLGTLQIECHKTIGDEIVCRSLFSGGEVLRNFEVQLVDEDNKVLASGKSDVEGKYAFKPPAIEYNVVVQLDRAHVASLSSKDIW